MHTLTIVMAIKQEDIDNILAPYEDELPITSGYEECICVVDGIADPKCLSCHGTGKVLYTYNPDGHWDWYEPYQPRGRWAGYIVPMKPSEVLAHPAEGWTGLPFAIVTPQEGWLEAGWDADDVAWAKIYWQAFDEAIKDGYKPFVVDVHD